MSSLDIGGDVFGFSGAEGIDEGMEVSISAGACQIRWVGAEVSDLGSGAWLVFGAEECCPGFAAAVEVHPALGAEKEVTDSDAPLIIGVEASDLELEDFAVGVFKDGCLGIGGFLGTLVSGVFEIAAAGTDFDRMFVFIQAPSGNIHLVHTLVADVTVACVPVPVPVIVEAFLVEWLILSGSEPEVIMHALWDGAVGDSSEGLARLVTKSFSHVDIAKLAFAEEFHSIYYVGV